MQLILKSKLMMLSGWATGLAFLFVFFSGDLSLNATALNLMDMFLSLFSTVFFLLLVSALSEGLKSVNPSELEKDRVTVFKKIQAVVLIFAFLMIGWFLLGLAPDSVGAERTTTTLGALLSGSCFIAMYLAFIQLLKRKKV